jgi:hypothetical protein
MYKFTELLAVRSRSPMLSYCMILLGWPSVEPDRMLSMIPAAEANLNLRSKSDRP